MRLSIFDKICIVVTLHFMVAHHSEAVDRPNFVLCMSDDQGWGDVGFRGHPHLKTPVMDEMAAHGIRFDRFHAAAPVCSPTRASFLTGRHPNRMGVFAWGHTLRPQEITIAEALREAGYTTGHFGKWHLGSVRSDSPVSPGNSGFDEWLSSPNFYENSPLMSQRGRVIATEGESSMVTVEAAIPFMQQAIKQEKPFLAVIWFGNPHTPHEAAEHLKELYPDLSSKEQNYYGEITGIDKAMGHLRSELKRLAVRENTFLLYTSDNGPQGRTVGSSGGLKGAKGSLWEGGTRVPAMIEWPARIDKQRIIDVPANTSDIYPTVLELAGVDSPHDFPTDGISLVNVIEGKQAARNQPMSFWIYTSKGVRTPSAEWLQKLMNEQSGTAPVTEAPPLSPTALVEKKYQYGNLGGHSAIIDDDWKLHAIPDKQGQLRYELYNIVADEAEKINVAESNGAIVKQLSRLLTDWRHSVIDSLNGSDYD